MACEIQLVNLNKKNAQGKHVRIRMWFGGYKQACATNTLKSLILNMLIGVTEVSLTFLLVILRIHKLNTCRVARECLCQFLF